MINEVKRRAQYKTFNYMPGHMKIPSWVVSKSLLESLINLVYACQIQ